MKRSTNPFRPATLPRITEPTIRPATGLPNGKPGTGRTERGIDGRRWALTTGGS